MGYPARLWAKMKCDYETGNFTIKTLHQKYTKTAKISIDTIKRRVGRWQKGRLAEKAEKTLQQRFIDAFAKRKFNEAKVATVLKKMVEADKTVIIPSGQEGQSGFAEQIPDWCARDKAITQYAKLTGAYAPQEQKLTGEITHRVVRIPAKVAEGTELT